jgi:Family of unknown function (DUF6529)
VEDLVETVTRGNVTQVKVVLASIVVALAAYQVLLMAVGYGKLRLRFLRPRPASFAHRIAGDTIVPVALIVAIMCVSYFGLEDEDGEELRAMAHMTAGSLLLAALTLKIVVIRWLHRWSRFLPHLGLTVFALFVVTWITSAGDYLWGG